MMFEILKFLKGLNVQRHITHNVVESETDENGHYLLVRIPLTEDDVKFYRGMQLMFAPVEDES